MCMSIISSNICCQLNTINARFCSHRELCYTDMLLQICMVRVNFPSIFIPCYKSFGNCAIANFEIYMALPACDI